MSNFTRLSELAAQLPKGLHSDWRDTNHYELTVRDVSDVDDYWWLMVADGLSDFANPCDTEPGQRFGLLMDIAAEVCRLKDEGVL